MTDDKLPELLKALEHKYHKTGQDMKAYLEGLLHANYTNYWDYVGVDTLLTLQKPKTDIPDEMIFIVYHQITELYFKLTLHEINQLSNLENPLDVHVFTTRLKRMNAYFRNLTHSFEIMVDGMDKNEFLKFRMSLLPASGFQSAQYRMIELSSTDLINLVDKSVSPGLQETDATEILFDAIYWKAGATELATGKKTLTLTQFEDKYSKEFIDLAKEYSTKNLWRLYQSLSEQERKDAGLIKELKTFDTYVNVKWPLMHYKSAVRYLQNDPESIAATGGTNWQKYLPPRFQKRIFFAGLWSEKEIEEWGKLGIID